MHLLRYSLTTLNLCLSCPNLSYLSRFVVVDSYAHSRGGPYLLCEQLPQIILKEHHQI